MFPAVPAWPAERGLQMISMNLIRKTIFSVALVAAPVAAFGQFSISVNFAPPILPVYAQPYCPGEGYLWTPGYWAYAEDGYFWVPGVWVQPPTIGYLWTPAYWGYEDNAYRFYSGYWGPHIGFYGGVNYGFGYGGRGYEGGYWDRDRFFYNRQVNNINVTNIHNVYVSNVTVVNNNYSRVSYNGGPNGVLARPQKQELQAQRDRHVEPTNTQVQHQQLASQDRGQFATVNNGRPQMAAARTPQDFQQRVQRAGFGAPGGKQPVGNRVDNRQANQTINAGQPTANRDLAIHDHNVRSGVPIDRPSNNGAVAPQQGRAIGQLNHANPGNPGNPVNPNDQHQVNVSPQQGYQNRVNPNATPPQQQQPYGQRQQLPQNAPQQQQQIRQPQVAQPMQQQRQPDYSQQRQAQQAAQQQQMQQSRQQQMQQQQAAQQQQVRQQQIQQQRQAPQQQQARPQQQMQERPQPQQHMQPQQQGGGHDERPRR
jgi:hypothetical protein